MANERSLNSLLPAVINHAEKHYVRDKARRNRSEEELLSGLIERTITMAIPNGYRSVCSIQFLHKRRTLSSVYYVHVARLHDDRFKLHCNQCNAVV